MINEIESAMQVLAENINDDVLDALDIFDPEERERILNGPPLYKITMSGPNAVSVECLEWD